MRLLALLPSNAGVTPVMPRLVWTICGVLTLAACWLGPLPELARHWFSAHMLIHMGVVAVAAAFLALGVAGGRFDPARRAPMLFSPVPASVVELVVVWAWHAPVLHHAARHTSWGMFAEQSMFLACGLFVWLSALGGPRPRSGARAAAGVIGLLLTSMHMVLLGALLIFAPRPLYSHSPPDLAYSAVADQQLGGAIMVLVGAASYLVGGLWLTFSLVRNTSDDGRQSAETTMVRGGAAGLCERDV